MSYSGSDRVRDRQLDTIAVGIGIIATMVSMSFCFSVASTIINYYTSWAFLPTIIVSLVIALACTALIWGLARGMQG